MRRRFKILALWAVVISFQLLVNGTLTRGSKHDMIDFGLVCHPSFDGGCENYHLTVLVYKKTVCGGANTLMFKLDKGQLKTG